MTFAEIQILRFRKIHDRLKKTDDKPTGWVPPQGWYLFWLSMPVQLAIALYEHWKDRFIEWRDREKLKDPDYDPNRKD